MDGIFILASEKPAQKRTFSGRASRPKPEQRTWDPKVSRSQNSIHTTALKRIAFAGLEIGAAWPHRDGKGFGVKLNLVPFSGTAEIVIRAIESKPAAQGVAS